MNLAQQPSGSPRRISPPQPGRLMLLPPTRILAEEAEEGHFLTVSDLRQGAVALSEELNHDPGRAKWEPVIWYWEAYDDSRFSMEQAELLREMTIELCSDANLLLKFAQSGNRAARRSRLSESLNGLAIVTLLAAILWAVPVAIHAFRANTTTHAVNAR